jgi:hypothetical protein
LGQFVEVYPDEPADAVSGDGAVSDAAAQRLGGHVEMHGDVGERH